MFFNKKLSTWQATLYKKSRLSLSHRLSVFFACIAFRIGFSAFLSTLDFLHMPASDFHLSSAPCRGAGCECGFCLVFLLLTFSGAVRWWEGGWEGGGAASALCVSWCVVFCALVGGHLFSGSTVPTCDFSHMLCI